MSSKMVATAQQIQKQGFLPMFFYEKKEVCLNILRVLHEANVHIIEFTNRGAEAYENFKALIETRNQKYPEISIGAGTIKSLEVANTFLEAGADFISSPGMIPEVGQACAKAGVLWIPGCMTITEIIQAEINEAKIVKLCPASLLKASFLVGVKNIFPELKFIPMGGLVLDRNELSPWFEAGATAVCVGSRLLGRPLLENEAYEIIERRLNKVSYLITTLKAYEKKEAAELEELKKYDHF